MGGVIVSSFLLAGLLCLLGVGLLVWLNRKDSSIESRSYDSKFNPGEMVSKYKVKELSEDDLFDASTLERYSQRIPKKGAAPSASSELSEDNVDEGSEIESMEHDESEHHHNSENSHSSKNERTDKPEEES